MHYYHQELVTSLSWTENPVFLISVKQTWALTKASFWNRDLGEGGVRLSNGKSELYLVENGNDKASYKIHGPGEVGMWLKGKN